MMLISRGMDKAFWREVREKECFSAYRKALLDDYDELIKKGPLKALKYSEFKMFFVNGNRSVYQDSYTVHGQALCVSALLSLIYPENEEYLEYLMDAIYAVCDEYTWCLPAHQPDFEVNNNSHIDLCASAKAFALAEIYNLLGDRLDPLIKSRIEAENERRVFAPFRNKEPYSWWETGTSNWTAVCTGSVACAFMLMRPDEARELLPRFKKSMEGFISGFTDEGVCLEGGGYWNYGFGNFIVYADMIKDFTDGEVDYFAIPKIKKVATFYQKIFLTRRAIANFADCGQIGSFVMGRMHYLKAQYPDEMKSTGAVYSAFSHTYDFGTRLREAMWFFEEDAEESNDRFYSDFYAPAAQWLVKRTPTYGFAAKGGHNAEHHNHNDIGHFIFAMDGRQILCDLGSGVYTKQYFSPERYLIINTSARGHSLPIIDGELQSDGRDHCARDVHYSKDKFSLDIAGAYNNLSPDEKIIRTFDLFDKSIKLTDSFKFEKERDIVERLVTNYDPDISTRGVVMIDGVALKYDSDAWEVSKSSEPTSTALVCHMIDFKPTKKVESFTVTIGE